MDDPGLVERLHGSEAQFSREIVKEISPLLSILLTWILPIVIFIGFGQYISKKLMENS